MKILKRVFELIIVTPAVINRGKMTSTALQLLWFAVEVPSIETDIGLTSDTVVIIINISIAEIVHLEKSAVSEPVFLYSKTRTLLLYTLVTSFYSDICRLVFYRSAN